jgi:hypothetical protein
MTNLIKLLFQPLWKVEKPSVVEIANKMRPVDEKKLRLPRSFAHTMRCILEYEKTFPSNPEENGIAKVKVVAHYK